MWSFVLTDLTGYRLGDLNDAHNRQLKFRLKQTPTLSLRTNLQSDLTSQILDNAGKLLIKAYEGDTLKFCGPIVTLEEGGEPQGDGTMLAQTLAINAQGPFWRLSKRHTGKSFEGIQFSGMDRAAIVQYVLEEANIEADTGIRMGEIETIGATDAGPWYYKPVSESITELASSLDGFDFEIEPTEPTPDSYGIQIGSLNLAASIGQERENAIWEYGTGLCNVQSYKRSINLDNMANAIYNLPPGFPDTTIQDVVSELDSSSVADYGLLETMVSGDLVSDELRERIAQIHLALRKQPRQTITFTPAEDPGDEGFMPQFGTDYDIGDLVGFRAVAANTIRVNGTFRVYGATITISDEGSATVEPVLVDEG